MSLLVRMPVVDVEVVKIQSSASKFKPPLGVVFLQSKRVSWKLDKQLWEEKQWHWKAKRHYCSNVGNPDPHVFWPPKCGSGSISQRYGSGSGSGHFPFLIKVLRGYNDFEFFWQNGASLAVNVCQNKLYEIFTIFGFFCFFPRLALKTEEYMPAGKL